MKKSFITGLAILLPAILTLIIVMLVVNLLTKPFQGAVEGVLYNYAGDNWSVLFINSQQIITIISKVLALFLIVLVTLLIGFLGRVLFFHYLFQFGHWIFHRIPFLNKVYKATQEVVGSLFKEDKASFSGVVLVPFPNASTRAIGFVTNSSQNENNTEEERISVFVPGTPNPTMGFMLKFRREQLESMNISVEQALKLIVSMGVMIPDSATTPQEKADER